MSSVLRKLQREVFILDVGGEMSSAPELAGFETLLRDDGELEVATDKKRQLNELFAELDRQGIQVISLRNKANRLEELFMGLVENKAGAA